jgi:hypothetical protein
MPACRSRLIAPLLGVLAAALLIIPASAPAGAVVDQQVIDENTCTTNEFFTNCFNNHFVFHTVLTPTGLSINNSLFHIELTSTGVPGGPFEGCVLTANSVHVGHFTDHEEITLRSFGRQREVDARNCNDAVDVECTSTFHFAFVNGRVVIDRSTNVCQPVPTA